MSNIITLNPVWTIYALHFSTLQAVFKMHCIYANVVVQPSVQHSRGNTANVTWYERQRFILDVDTDTFVQMYLCEEKKHGCKDFLTLPYYMLIM